MFAVVIFFGKATSFKAQGPNAEDVVDAPANSRLELSGPISLGDTPTSPGGTWECLSGRVKSKERLHYCWGVTPPDCSLCHLDKED